MSIRKTRIRPIVATLLSTLMLGSPLASHAAEPTSSDHGQILWDTFGVPHIYGKDEAGTFYGFGWAQAHSYGNIVLKLYGTARGRAAEYWGKSEEESDRWVLANGVYDRAKTWYAAQEPSFRKDLDAFAQGINDYATKHPNDISDDVKAVLPVSGVDVVAHSLRLMNYVYIASETKMLGEPPERKAGGSNTWAIAPSRMTDGHAVLLANPHLPWSYPFFRYYEAQMNGPGFSMYGATQIGLPVLRFAFTKDVAFSNTVNTILGAIRYRLTPDGDGYRFDGKTRKFDTKTIRYKVKSPDGTLQDRSFEQRYAVQGPVFKQTDGSLMALYVAGLDRPGMLRQYWDMGRSHNFAEFQSAVKKIQIPMFNIVYADHDGHIMYLDNGILPKHSEGDFNYWNAPVSGETSATLPKGIVAYEDLPKVIDPSGGFVQNANDPPWVSTYPRVLHPEAYPAYVSLTGPMSLRAQMSVTMLTASGKMSYEDVIERKLNTHSLLAQRILPQLLEAAAGEPRKNIADAIRVLKSWDQADNADSRGALLFETWARLMMGPKFTDFSNFARGWSLDDPIHTPDGLKDPAQAVNLLDKAVIETRKLYGAIDTPFGKVSRFHIGNVNLPGNGGFGNTGIFRTITWGPMKDGQRTPFHGETWVSIVSFSSPMRAKGLLSYGNSGQPGSTHQSDQLSYLSSKTLRDLWLTRAEQEAHLETVDSLK
ncbi:penicilin amidase [Gluconobacter thailandicus F149-1 = NBRC 100600]|nr:penicillin acylase family protein [Gluconobacter thailandicus]GAN94728.1 penicilin amidase [Gluconobacter thailandicus F149-1 = NBRC 100600]GEL88235.1 7-beta-(4-carbaxybutanamido)cephalosporanic acid acylase [Gluconobacter thailandicus F149-1 = NBRC 100600]